jgi:hypothetical protein
MGDNCAMIGLVMLKSYEPVLLRMIVNGVRLRTHSLAL